jgi:hypothetical protein
MVNGISATTGQMHLLTDSSLQFLPSLEQTIMAILGNERVAIMVDYIVPLNVGTSGYTEYVIDPVKLFEVYDAHPELENTFMGHVHSHNSMGVFFSGTDNEQLEDGAMSNSLFVSMIVNNRSDVTAKASIALGVQYMFGDTVVSAQSKSVIAYPTKLLFGGSKLDETFSRLCSVLQKEREFPYPQRTLFEDRIVDKGKKGKEKGKKEEREVVVRNKIYNDVDEIFGGGKKPSDINDIIDILVSGDENRLLDVIKNDHERIAFGEVLNDVADFAVFSEYMGVDEASWSKTNYGLEYEDFMIMLFNMYMELFKQSVIAAYISTVDDRFDNKKDPIGSFFSIMRSNDIIDLYTDTLYTDTNIINDADCYNAVVLHVDKMLKYALSKVSDILSLTVSEIKEFKIASVSTRYIIISDWLKKEDRPVVASILANLRNQRNNLIEEINGTNKSKNGSSSMVIN